MPEKKEIRRERCRELLAALIRERPGFHGWTAPGSHNYAISDEVLKWIADHFPEGGRSLETGCGYSSMLFAALSRTHTAISLFQHEHELIRKWGKKHGLSMKHVNWITGRSQDHLPKLLPNDPLDMILIDGDHAFPAPFMDWYYTADWLSPGGYLLVDDIQLATGRILKEFLEAEKGRWVLLEMIDKTVIFERVTADPVARGVVWPTQPWVGLSSTGKE